MAKTGFLMMMLILKFKANIVTLWTKREAEKDIQMIRIGGILYNCSLNINLQNKFWWVSCRYFMKWLFKWTASSEFGTYRLWEQRRFRRACASAQSRQNLRCSLIQAMSESRGTFWQKARSQAPLNGLACAVEIVMTECSKTQIRLTGLKC